MKNIEIMKNDIRNKTFIYIWWTYSYSDLLEYAKNVELEVDERILAARSPKMLARYVKVSVTSELEQTGCSNMITAFGIERLVIMDEDDYQAYKDMFTQVAMEEVIINEKC